MKKIILTAMAFIMSTSFSYAFEKDKLIKISENKYQTLYGVKGSLKQSENYAKMWTVVKYKKGASKIVFRGDFPTMTEHVQSWAFDCKQNKIKSLSLDIYNKNGIVIYSEGESEASEVIPGSIGEDLFAVACYENNQQEEEKIKYNSL